MALELRFLPAAEGDAVWIRWDGGHQMLVDMGREECGPPIRARIEALPPEQRHFDLLVVTHVDADHIGGVLTGLAEADPLEGLGFDDVWFNGWPHLNGAVAGSLEPMGAVQGERLSSWLSGKPWNKAFEGGAVARADPPQRIELDGGLVLTVLGPPRHRLAALRPTWADEVRRALTKGTLTAVPAGLEAFGRARPIQPVFNDWRDIAHLADSVSKPDSAPANGTSICLLLEWGRRRVLLTGDAWAPDVLDGLKQLHERLPIALDVVKLPHHGSEANFSAALADAITCPRWVISTNGARFYHPDAAAVARLVRREREPRPKLVFNVPSEFNKWWRDPAWRGKFNYATTTGTETNGVRISLDPRPT
jgi:hypothetical protein